MRRFVALLIVAIVSLSGAAIGAYQDKLAGIEFRLPASAPTLEVPHDDETLAITMLDKIAVKGRAPKTDYKRSQFGSGWQRGSEGCDTRNIILLRDLTDAKQNGQCKVISGTLHDPYTGKNIQFVRSMTTSSEVQIDHVVALSNAWQTGAQLLEPERRMALANDPVNLLAVDGPANQQKGDADAATWLPPNKPFRCQYVARQIAVKYLYDLWVTPAEKDAMMRVLVGCPAQKLPTK